MNNRSVRQIAQGVETSDGAGVKLRRVIGNRFVRNLDPFLMLDEFKSDEHSDYAGGFPMHPHRGFETVTYLLEGAFIHRDNQGNTGYLEPGSIQWMTAGRGIIHEEMPNQADGPVWGFQLWVNLPSKDKMQAPRYQDIPTAQIPVVELQNGRVKVLVGQYQGVQGPVRDVATNPIYLDVRLDQAGASTSLALEAEKQGFVYVYRGSARVGGTDVQARQLAILSEGDALSIEALSDEVGLIVVAGEPIKEPVVQYGPFVMNTSEEIEQAIDDFNAGRF